MEIKVEATDDPSPPTFNYSLLPNQALNAGTLSSFRQRSDINVVGSCDKSLEALVAREIEKRKIKEEIMTYGYLKRWELEEEVIRELILERESATGQAEGVSVVDAHLYSLQSGLHGLISNNRDVVDLRERPALAKPKTSDASLGSKRKLETPTVDCDDRAALGGKGKKLQKRWSCELCQVKVSSEQRMKDHLNGKKHMAKEKAMQITTKSVSNCFYESDSPTEKNEKSSEYTISIGTTSPNPTNPSNIVGGNQDRRNVEALNSKQADFKFWCKMCEVGTTSEASMTNHRMGKKHTRLLKKKGKSVSNCSNESDSPTEENEKSNELTIPTATTSPNPSNIVGGNQDWRKGWWCRWLFKTMPDDVQRIT